MASGEKRETSYYEVALTNRQVVGAFVILLVGLMVSFLAGVLVGRDNEAPAKPTLELAEAGTRAEEKAAPQDVVEKLDFFAGGGPEPTNTEPATPEPVIGEPTDLEPAAEPETQANPTTENGAERLATPPSPSPTPAAAAPASDVPVPRLQSSGAGAGGSGTTPRWRHRGQVAKEAEELESEFASEEAELVAVPPAGAESSPAPPAPVAPPQGPPKVDPTPKLAPPVQGVFVVQVFSSSDAAKARGILDTLKDAGYPAMLLRNDQATPAMYRVRVGPYRDRPAAQKAAEELRTRLRVETWVTSE